MMRTSFASISTRWASAQVVAALAAALGPHPLRACLANVLSDCGVMLGPSHSAMAMLWIADERTWQYRRE
jgi:hypothetical protein